MNQSTSNGPSLHLAAAELMRKVASTMLHADLIEHRKSLFPYSLVMLSSEQQRHFHILHQGHCGKEVEELENHAQFCAAEECQFMIVSALQMDAIDHHFTACGVIQSSKQIEQGAFSGAALARDGDKFPMADIERNGIKGNNRRDAIRSRGFDETNHDVHK